MKTIYSIWFREPTQIRISDEELELTRRGCERVLQLASEASWMPKIDIPIVGDVRTTGEDVPTGLFISVCLDKERKARAEVSYYYEEDGGFKGLHDGRDLLALPDVYFGGGILVEYLSLASPHGRYNWSNMKDFHRIIDEEHVPLLVAEVREHITREIDKNNQDFIDLCQEVIGRKKTLEDLDNYRPSKERE